MPDTHRTHPDLAPPVNAAGIVTWHAQAAAALERMALIREHDCPRCTGSDSDIGRACTSRLDADTREIEAVGLSGAMCRYAPVEAQAAHERDITGDRVARLHKSGLRDERISALLPPLRVPPAPEYVSPADRAHAIRLMRGAEEYLRQGTALRVLVLLGPPGAGKSAAAAWVVAARGGTWVCASEARNFERWRGREEHLTAAPLVVLDDIGTEGMAPEFCRDSIRALLEGRLDSNARTVITGNLTRKQIAERYGDRVTSRLADKARVLVVEAPGAPDLRRAKREAEAWGDAPEAA